MEPKGNVLIKKEFKATTLWPDVQINPFTGQRTDLEKEYKEALAGKMVTVMDIAVDGSGYLVLSETKDGGAFIWTVEKEDTVGFIPLIKKGGVVMPAGLSPIEQFVWIAKSMDKL